MTAHASLTVVVPFRAPRRSRGPLRRLARVLGALPPGWRAVVVDDSAPPAAAETARLVARFVPARHLVHAETRMATFSVGRLRDAGAEAAGDGLVMFHDVDFFAPRPVYLRLAAHIAAARLDETPGAFLCVPVAFLTRLGSALARRAPTQLWHGIARSTARRLGIVNRVVLGSSAIVADRRTLLEAGGHDPVFEGHGAEDFDLMHRLSARFPMGPRPPDYAVDYGPRNRAAGGFRTYFGRYGAPTLAAGLALAHDWHPPRREDPRYHAARAANFAALAERMEARDGAAPQSTISSEAPVMSE